MHHRRRAAVAAILLTAGVAVAQPSGARAQDPVRCFGAPATVLGSEDPDVLIGTFGRDAIASLGGNDVVRGDPDFGGATGGDADRICLGAGDDVADGASGGDRIDGGIGNDVLDGDSFPDNGGNDSLFGGAGNDTVTGGVGNDVLFGGPGNDFIDPPGGGIGAPPSTGRDVVAAGAGDDVITEADGAVDLVSAGPGDDSCIVDVADRVVGCETVVRVPLEG